MLPFFAVIQVLLSAALVGLDPHALGPRHGPRRHGLHADVAGWHAHRRAQPHTRHDRGRGAVLPELASCCSASCSSRRLRPHGARRPAPRDVRLQRRAADARLLPRRGRLRARQEDGQLRRPAQLPPVLRRRGGQPRHAADVLRVAARGARPPRPRDARVDRARRAGGVGGDARSRIRTGCGSSCTRPRPRACARCR